MKNKIKIQKCLGPCGLEKPISSFLIRNKKTNLRRRKCKECMVQYNKNYYNENKQKIIIRTTDYRIINKKSLSIKANEYYKMKRKTNPVFRIGQYISGAIRYGLKKTKKNSSSWKNLLYTQSELRAHLESLFEFWMTWENHGKYNSKSWNDNDSSTWTWQIDHIIPHSTFQYDSMDCEQFHKCWVLSNLRPLSAKQNLYDGFNKTRHKGLNGHQIT